LADDETAFITCLERLLQLMVSTNIADMVNSIGAELQPYAALRVSAATVGGKRLRPRFAYWSSRAAGAQRDELPNMVALGTALELLHAAILVHDDIIDSSPLRRGQPSVPASLSAHHRKRDYASGATEFGDHAALRVRDLLWTTAHDAITDALIGLPAPRSHEVTAQFQTMRQEVLAGQLF
jgi:geranylgeranyl diphosphate synthase type I